MALYQQLPFFNPSVPFTRLIQGGLQEGTSITVCGRVLSDADSSLYCRFQVDLKYGSDIALHFNPRYEGGSEYVMHNTLQRGRWGSEERKYETPFPRGQMFALQILVTLSSYQISTNGKPFSEYKHRMPFSWVDRIHVSGNMEVKLVAFQYLVSHQRQGSFTVPYKSIIHGGLQLGKVIIIQGFINPQANRVVISLRHKAGIAFVYNAGFDENLVLCNTYGDGKWGEEEQSEVMPFKKGQPLQVTIFCSRHQYQVFVNGEQTHTYSHRHTKLEEIDVLEVSGDVQLSFVQP
ncbi:galectin-9-like isoform X1 [Sinocyclocheilus grahami]|uniref:galectin-9-like isoform X1 n=1 Tax=Sinocyclocheilus grahami TaxID=75366 RepID=UPI0007ACA99F|nr:PREDICTED: galectin-9-like isoform X1 [Sinocyclocheilus grahami]